MKMMGDYDADPHPRPSITVPEILLLSSPNLWATQNSTSAVEEERTGLFLKLGPRASSAVPLPPPSSTRVSEESRTVLCWSNKLNYWQRRDETGADAAPLLSGC